jgi:hypothetical protein
VILIVGGNPKWVEIPDRKYNDISQDNAGNPQFGIVEIPHLQKVNNFD